MLTTVVALATMLQTPPPDYSVPAGVSSEFHHLVIDIETKMAAKDFAGADKLAKMLPRTSVSYYINTANLDEYQKEEFPAAIRNAIGIWEKMMSHSATFTEAKSKSVDVLMGFEPVLAKLPNSNMVAGATWFLATEPTLPMVEAVFGLKRGEKLERTSSRELYNETLFTIGRYFGLAPNPIYGTAMGRYDGKYSNPNDLIPAEVTTVRKILALSHNLRQAIQDKKSIEVAHASINLDKKSLQFETKFQGDEGRASIVVTNTGSAPLELSVRGDCGCITGKIVPVLEPGKSTMLTGIFNTTEIQGDVNHNLVLRTNDADNPNIVIPCSIHVNPRAEFIYPESNTIYFDGQVKDFVFYLNSTEKKPIEIQNALTLGGTMPVTYEPFEGDVANYLTPGKTSHVRGYKITVGATKYPTKEALFGRTMSMVYLKTDHPVLTAIKISLFLQRGIAVLPESLYLGSPKGMIDSGFYLTRPGRPFAIKKISSDSPYLQFSIERTEGLSGSEYFVKVVYDGKAPAHRIKSTIVITTDDPKQGTIQLPVSTSGA